MNLDYFHAAEQDIRSLPYLKKAIKTLEKRRAFIVSQEESKPGTNPTTGSEYLTEKQINAKLNEALALAEITAEIVSAKHEVEMIEGALYELDQEERDTLIMFYQDNMSADRIAGILYRESDKTVYKLRNKAIMRYCLLYYGTGKK